MTGPVGVSPPPVRDAPPYARITCAINGTRTSAEAIRQGLALAGPEVPVNFVAVTDARGVGLNRMAGVGEHRARQALDAACALARDKSISATTELIHAPEVAGTLLRLQDPHDLLVVGSGSRSGGAGVLSGGVATTLARRTTGCLLVSRPRRATGRFPANILVVVQEGVEEPLKDLAARLAAASGGGIRFAPIERLDEVDGWGDADLVIAGRGGPSGVPALRSVSERIVHAVGCSVLLAADP
jgi:nucleotide-binding universal stress UspA family protein